MKYMVSFFVFLTGVSALFAQQPIKESLYAPALKDSVEYTVYQPADWEGWDNRVKHPVIYAINYGMINGDYIAAQVSYFRKARYALPNNVIVVINASMQKMGYSYETGQLSPEGISFVDFIKEKIFPAVERKFNTSEFRTYIGHSFAGSFGNYLFLNQPGMFKGFIILGPEKIGDEHPPFHLSSAAKEYYNSHYTFYYTAAGQYDLQRRRDYAKETGKETAQLDSSKFFFRYDSISRGDHTSILTLSIQFAMEHLFQFYTPYSGKDEPNVLQDLNAIRTRLKQMYDLEPEKNFTFYNPFAQEAIANKDSTGLIAVLQYFDNDRLQGWNLMQFGEFCLKLDQRDKAKYYLEKAIAKIIREEMSREIGPRNLTVCYSDLAFNIEINEPEKAWVHLQKALAISTGTNKFAPKDGEAYLNLGKFSALHRYRPADGLRYLEFYVNNKTYPDSEQALFYSAKCALLLDQPEKAKSCLKRILMTNHGHKEAADLLKQISGKE